MRATTKTYMGRRCTKDHAGLRYVSTGGCVHCALIHAAGQKRNKQQGEKACATQG